MQSEKSSLGVVLVGNGPRFFNRESPVQFENRIKPRVCIRRITQSFTMFVRKSSILLADTGVKKNSPVACGFIPIKIHFSDPLKSLISRIIEVYVFFNKISLNEVYVFFDKISLFIYNRLFCRNCTCYCVGMVSVTSAHVL